MLIGPPDGGMDGEGSTPKSAKTRRSGR